MNDPREVYESLDLALRVGEVLLTSGAGAADVTNTMVAVTTACGVRNVSADIGSVDLTLRHQPSPGEPAALQVRRVTQREVDYSDLTEIDQTVSDLVAGRITRAEAQTKVAQIVSTGHSRPRWAVTVGWGFLGLGIALTLGGSVVVCLVGFVAACLIHWTTLLMSRRRIPRFYIQAAGGFVATLVAMASVTAVDLNPSRVVTVGIVMLLSGIGLMGAMQDALNGFPMTASARLLDAVLDTTGIIAGVSGGLSLATLLGVGMGSIKPGASGLAETGVTVVGAAVAAAAFGYASYAPGRSLIAVALVSALGQGVQLAVTKTQLGGTWASALAAVTIGGVCYLVSDRVRVPPLVVVVPAIVPLLPGLAIYRGLALLASGEDGVLQLAAALASAVALASGVILGQYISHPLRREAVRLETRLTGPRMVGLRRRKGTSRS